MEREETKNLLRAYAESGQSIYEFCEGLEPAQVAAVKRVIRGGLDEPETRADLAIIGRERALVNKLVKALRTAARDHGTSSISETRRGSSFEVLIHVGGEPTGHVARVAVELDRFDRELVEAYQAELTDMEQSR